MREVCRDSGGDGGGDVTPAEVLPRSLPSKTWQGEAPELTAWFLRRLWPDRQNPVPSKTLGQHHTVVMPVGAGEESRPEQWTTMSLAGDTEVFDVSIGVEAVHETAAQPVTSNSSVPLWAVAQ